jgi:hypothetical protein
VTPIGFDRVNITDIQAIWAIYPDIIFNVADRILGTLDDIVNTLENVKLYKKHIYKYINSNKYYISKINHLTYNSKEYHNELENYDLWKESTIQKYSKMKDKSLLDLLILTNPHMIKQRKNTIEIYNNEARTLPKSNIKNMTNTKVEENEVRVLPMSTIYEYSFSIPDSSDFKKMSVDDIKKIMILLKLKDLDYVGKGKNGSLLRQDRINILNGFSENYGGNIIQIDRPINGANHASYRNL